VLCPRRLPEARVSIPGVKDWKPDSRPRKRDADHASPFPALADRFSGRPPLPIELSPVPVEILLVEDSVGDAELMVEALGASKWTIRVTVIEDGEEALQHLRREAPHGPAARPDLILLDLHLPRKNGHEILGAIKQDENLRTIPVIVLTSFDTEEAILRAYDLHANCCIRKPSDLEQLALTVKTLESFWLQHARLQQIPRAERHFAEIGTDACDHQRRHTHRDPPRGG